MILYIQFECDDDIHRQVEETIDFYAGGIAKDLRKPDKYLLFKDAWLISVFFKYPDVETATRKSIPSYLNLCIMEKEDL